MLRHGADAMADAILDGCADAVRGCMRAGAHAAAHVARIAKVTRIASTRTLRPVPVRAFSRVSSHA
jgi:hypothetical protein